MAEIATRKAYGTTLVKLADEGMDVVALDADLAEATYSNTFRAKYPERFIDCGIAESSMVNTAAGIATTGKIVFAGSFAVFTTGRAYDQVRNGVAYPGIPVNLIGSHAGLSVGEDGETHQCFEDIALMRVLPGMTVLSPCDAHATEALLRAAAALNGPTYTRLGRLPVPLVYPENVTMEIGKGYTLREGDDIAIITTGLMVAESLKAADELRAAGVHARVIDMPTIKPLDRDIVLKAAKETGLILTAEEHSVIGGLGGAVCELLSEEYPCRVRRIGVQDKFGKSGPARKVLEMYGLCADNIVKTARQMLGK